MEAFQEAGMENFTESFGTALFKVEKIEYHKNGRISKIDFTIT